MKILVVGSWDFDGGEQIQEKFASVCQQLGASLARAGHTIVVGSSKKGVADRHVVFGANSVDGRHKVLVVRPAKGAIPFETDHANLTKIDFRFRRRKGPWAVGRIYQILEAEGVIMIGGGRGTAQVGYTAPVLERPVLAIAALGGAARDAWEEYLDADYDRLGLYDHRFLDGKFANLGATYDKSTADLAVKSIEELVKRNPYRSKQNVLQSVIVVLPILLLAVWVGLFVKPMGSMTVSFFLLLFFSALLGNGLRTIIRFTRDKPKISVSRLFNEGVQGLLLAFGLALVYLAGGITITGNMKFVNIGEYGDFQRIAVSMSMLGFSAGFLIKSATEQLTRRLENVLAVKDQ